MRITEDNFHLLSQGTFENFARQLTDRPPYKFSRLVVVFFLIVSGSFLLTWQFSLEDFSSSTLGLFFRTILPLFFTGTIAAFVLLLTKRLEARLSNKKTQLDHLFVCNPNAMWIYDRSTLAFVDVNDAAIAQYKYSREEFLTKTILDIRPSEDCDKFLSRDQSQEDHFNSAGIWRHIKKDGSIMFVEVSGYPVSYRGRECELIMVHDVSRLVHAEIELRKHNDQLEKAVAERTRELTLLNEDLKYWNKCKDEVNLELIHVNEQLQKSGRKIAEQREQLKRQKNAHIQRILDNHQDVVWSYDFSKEAEHFLSPSAFEKYNQTNEAFSQLKLAWKQRAHPADQHVIDESHRRLMKDGRSDCTYRILNSDNHQHWIYCREWIIRDETGNIVRTEGIVTDVTYIRQTEQIISENHALINTLFDNLSVSLILLDTRGEVLLYNKITELINTLWGSKIQQGENIIHLAPADRAHIIAGSVNEVIQSKKSVAYNIRYQSGQLGMVCLSVHYNPVFNQAGDVEKICMVVQDITEKEKALELELAMSREKEISQMRSRLLSTMSHEFKTPLQSIAVCNSAMQKNLKRVSKANSERMNLICRQVRHMTFMLEDTLAIGKTEVPSIQINSAPVNLQSFFSKMISELTMDTGRVVDVSIHGEVSQIHTDEKLLRNIFINIVGNALKFSAPETKADVRILACNHNIEVEVTDRGIGIYGDDIKKIFEPFSRCENAAKIPGSGLGLSIAKKATELLKGNISAESKPGVGTTFRVTLPHDLR